MKTALLFPLFVILALFATAQTQPVNELMSKGAQPGVSIEIEGLGPKPCEKYWKAYLTRQGSKPRRDRKTKEWIAENVRLAGTNLTVYSKVEGTKTRSTVVAWFEQENEFVAADDPSDNFRAMDDFLTNFGHYVDVEEMQLEVEGHEKDLKKLEADMSKLERDHAHYEQEIERAKERILTMEKNIERNLEEQEVMKGKVSAQQGVVTSARDELEELRKGN